MAFLWTTPIDLFDDEWDAQYRNVCLWHNHMNISQAAVSFHVNNEILFLAITQSTVQIVVVNALVISCVYQAKNYDQSSHASATAFTLFARTLWKRSLQSSCNSVFPQHATPTTYANVTYTACGIVHSAMGQQVCHCATANRCALLRVCALVLWGALFCSRLPPADAHATYICLPTKPAIITSCFRTSSTTFISCRFLSILTNKPFRFDANKPGN